MHHTKFHALWIGGELSRLERLTLVSFVACGHQLTLWHYHKITSSIPAGVILADASIVIPRGQVFSRKYADPERQIGLNSFGSPFSDLFRYKLLHQYGGWWVDMDVTCLKRVDIVGPYVFRTHHRFPLVGNIMAVPRRCPVMHDTYSKVSQEANAETLDWMLPNIRLGENVLKAGLSPHIRSDIVNSDEPTVVDALLTGQRRISESWYFVHWCNERLRSIGFDKDHPPRNGELSRLMIRFGV